MLDSIRRWFRRIPLQPLDKDIARWVSEKAWTARAVREPGGAWAVDGGAGNQPWRMEWGASKRSFIRGSELRLFSEMGIHRDLQVVVLNRDLMETLEKSAFDQYIEGVQTRIDTETPQETRWLVMFPKLNAAEMRELWSRYGAAANHKPWLLHWLAGPMGAVLDASQALLAPGSPVVWTVSRGRLTLRTEMNLPTVELLEGWLEAFETALREALQASNEFLDLDASRVPTTQPAWTRTSPTDGDATSR